MSQAYRDKVRVICHSLRMASLTGVDPAKVIDLSSRIRALPPPEKIASMEHGSLAELSTRVERIIFDIGNAKNSRTFDFAIRHRIEKGLPTRLSPVIASGEGTWLEKGAAEEEGKDYSKTLSPEWNASKTSQKIGKSRIFRLNFGTTPVLDFTLSRSGDKYDGGIDELRYHPGIPYPRGVRPPCVMEIASMAHRVLGDDIDFETMPESQFHQLMREGLPAPGEE